VSAAEFSYEELTARILQLEYDLQRARALQAGAEAQHTQALRELQIAEAAGMHLMHSAGITILDQDLAAASSRQRTEALSCALALLEGAARVLANEAREFAPKSPWRALAGLEHALAEAATVLAGGVH
jgi:hypothetical protein